ncbi:MAG TPA: hypothetical protein VFO67_01925, partial [Gemmatimonadales bacterium]|nr:hypothetical protein [Gemmatimonadales bacterium]
GFGTAFGLNPCWIVDGGCEFMGTGSRHCCCKPESAENLYFRSSREQFCEHEGGSILTGPCESTCEEICTKLGAVPVTWGRLKARY